MNFIIFLQLFALWTFAGVFKTLSTPTLDTTREIISETWLNAVFGTWLWIIIYSTMHNSYMSQWVTVIFAWLWAKKSAKFAEWVMKNLFSKKDKWKN